MSLFRNNRFLLFSLLLCFLSIIAPAQNIFTEGAIEIVPTVRFQYQNPASSPSNYTLSVDATGEAEYISSGGADEAGEAGKSSDTGAAEPFKRRFQVSKATRDRIFMLTKALRNFQGEYEFTKHRVAFSGKKRFTYVDGAEEHETEINWSENKDIMELANLFQGMAATLEAESRLLHLRRFDKLGLNAELANLERQANSGWLKELPAITKVLREIVNDRAVMGIARNRAERLLKMAQATP